ncbi:hypothetical protein CERSUDRAFT_82208 [Gelatoporia subvermispora B]|uniref:Chromo domain-containing protein n=1 Tax=Ceriporiopsis subvermispora (strain B) TaxID=914234 RepID=M2R0H8_CERS8|nr:hypothetical protein CERSUDRAFT_82208 [Gelatoporia subvermispora B]
MSEEYEVETIIRAKVVKHKRGRKAWSYCVKWKNYDIEDNTWEPSESFAAGSEHFITHFWQRVDLHGKDYQDLTQFDEDEEVLPTGPPRKAKKTPQKPKRPSPSPEPEMADDSEEVVQEEEPRGRKRRSSNVVNVEHPSAKRPRGRRSQVQDGGVEESSPERMVTRRRSVGRVPAPASRAQPGPLATSSSRRPAPRKEKSPPASPVRSARKAARASPVRSTRKAVTTSSAQSAKKATIASPVRSSKRPRKPTSRVRNSSPDEMLLMPVQSDEVQTPYVEDTDAMDVEPDEDSPSTKDAPRPRKMPAHRARKANPRVKVIEDEDLGVSLEKAIPAKARLTTARRGRVSSSKAGPGRLSSGAGADNATLPDSQEGLATPVKGKSSAKGKYTPLRVNGVAFFERGHLPSLSSQVQDYENGRCDMEPISGPSGIANGASESALGEQPLVEVAGLNRADAEALSDYEEDAAGETDPSARGRSTTPDLQLADLTPSSANDVIIVRQKGETDMPSEQVEAPVEVPVVDRTAPKFPHVTTLFSNGGSAASKETKSPPLVAGWSLSTIFGPLGFGRGVPAQKTEPQSSPVPVRPTVTVNLDTSVKIPVTLKDIHPLGSFDDLHGKTTALPGKFYKEQNALSLLDSLKLKDAAARFSLEANADEDLKEHFQRFCSRLFAGELFVEQVGFELLAMCAADNTDLSRRLNIPEALKGLVETVVVTRVDIQDYSMYTDAVFNAEQSR